MIWLSAIGLAAVGTWLIATGGFLMGRWWQHRHERTRSTDTEAQVGRILDRIADTLVIEDRVADAVDPLATDGRAALDRVLSGLRDVGGYEAVVVADDAGLVIAGVGASETAELLAIEAAAFGAAAERIRGQRQTIIHTQPEKQWSVHRFFTVDSAKLSLSASRRGGTPRVEALDGALGAFQRVLAVEDIAA